ncbi:helix-turn-helix domain-containing protein [Salmonella enterica subsp. enterica serovar Enteritidis]|nr:helix-turn-helix domain-containing protein [Salmonella enterica subsp. enterica serovar Enteritidis]EGT9239789.1 helix-turn-helix domain-containing protein [Salmonella enterica]
MNKYSDCRLIYIRKTHTLMLSGQKLTFQQGDLILMRNGSDNNFIENFSVMCIHFSVNLLYEYFFFNLSDVVKSKGIYRKDHIAIQPHKCGVICETFREFEFMDSQNIKKNAIHFLLSYFHQERNFFPFFLTFYSVSHKISVIIRTDVRHLWRLEEIAGILCLCISTVKKHLKKEGVTFIKILTECRMQHAAGQLSISNKNVKSISAECGYSNVSYFITTFTNHFGLSPHHYAQRYSCL